MLTVHHLGISQSDRIVWLCEELEIPYELKKYDRDPVTRLAPAEYKALHPCETAPVITDGDLVLGESAAIVDYTDYLYWFHFANGSFMPAGMIDLVLLMLGVPDQDAVRLLRARSDRAYAM